MLCTRKTQSSSRNTTTDALVLHCSSLSQSESSSFSCIFFRKTIFNLFYYIKVSGIPSGNKLIKISSHVKIAMITLISSLSLKLYLNLLVHNRNILGSSSKGFGNLREFSDIFGTFRKFSENVRERSFGLRSKFGKSSEIFGKWSEIFGKSSKSSKRSKI